MDILITGVSRGLGKALSDEFAQQGHRVAGCARSETAIAQMRESFSDSHHFSVVDLTSDSAVQGWIETVEAQWGVPDLVINNASIINENAPLWEVPFDEFEQLMKINVIGVFSVIRHVLPSMMERGTGVIANMSSGWGRSVSADVAAYCASKWAIEGMSQALAQDLPDGMAVVPVNPGVINTEMLQSCFGASAKDAPTPAQWVQSAAPFFLGLGPEDNGQQRTV